ncbi:uncharacterized protein B0I36DRAFT_237964 [Microdochium trichocladiopsis]|uniref:Iron-sulfur cluster assembly factor IBA57 homolog, mitochondrial n=1 Tax=Microdochium trichocladiopsis TaxID=1682393 RepID=A0A9P8YFN6_9PEZI|nr:uncharacterized protein B0I36DRAFT_237964 [Microdochium trichocladiopsis]KAH7038121.1 hypothetical protein B0I36DRAFT_237964 [Microdochium trichocladiopsis]
MHAVPRQAASRASSTSRAVSTFVCPSCANLTTGGPTRARLAATAATTTRSATTRHLSTTAHRRHAASTATSTSSPPPATPPTAGYARLTSRRLISIAGVDAARFLQGIVTSSTLNRTEGFYTGFLNATGRVLHDVFIYPDTLGVGVAGEAFIIEVDADQADTLLKHLKRYRLRSKFQIAPVDEDQCGVWQVWNDSPRGSGGGGGAFTENTSTTSTTTNTGSARRIILPDTRAPGLGHRILSTTPPADFTSELESLGLSPASDDLYRVRRYLHGVPEGQAEILREAALPLEANMDLMGGIDFRKGCYVGQELTIRTKHRGVVRKRILPCVLYPADTTTGGGDGVPPAPDKLEYYTAGGAAPSSSTTTTPTPTTTAESIPQGSAIVKAGARKGRGAGTWLRGVGNVGLALCRLQVMTDVELPGEAAAGGGGLAPFDPATEFVVKLEEDGGVQGAGSQVKIKAFVPPWLRQRLDEANASKH